MFIPCRFLEAFHRIVREKSISEHFNKKKFFSVLHIPDLTNSNVISAHGSAEHRDKDQRAFKMKLKNKKKSRPSVKAKCFFLLFQNNKTMILHCILVLLQQSMKPRGCGGHWQPHSSTIMSSWCRRSISPFS